ncbi:sperm acrosome developmental regulator-like isoform X7 [Dunckerocampus dactyliophorus]|uniref:sperm acrosome developmental regulator-like isoform X7 n=1 Tax=Dunckerocampus dactyliophorus TaxID=161453 RepID=UPI002405367E|nr:sperm acrosome developmental regulator-like isoform X7 [Dunckerocampus dactyliophorus]
MSKTKVTIVFHFARRPAVRMFFSSSGQKFSEQAVLRRNVDRNRKLDNNSKDVEQSVLRLSRSQPSSPPAGAVHLTPIQAPAAFGLDQSIFSLPADISSCSSSVLAIDNKIQQAMDLVKSHLMLAVREEVELLREQIKELQEKNQQLEAENHILRTHTHI